MCSFALIIRSKGPAKRSEVVKSPPKDAPKPADVELEPDAWERFTAAVGKVVKAPPKPVSRGPDKKGGRG